MSALLDATLGHLRALVGFDTRNPPRAIGTDGIFDYLQAQLPGFACTLTDHGAGAVSLLAVRGTPRLLFNVHLDTVPDSPHWSADPHVLRVEGDRAVGLGACDIKGAAAALLAVAQVTDGPLALLFSTDEEANDARCIPAFLRAFPPLPAAPARAANLPPLPAAPAGAVNLPPLPARGEGWGEGPVEAPPSALAEPSPPAPLPAGEGSSATFAGTPDGGHARLPLPPGEGRGEGAVEALPSALAEPPPSAPLPTGEGSGARFEAVIIAEPTNAEAVLAHRGIHSVLMRFAGHAGHASGEQRPSDSAVHQAMRWGAAALDFVEAQAHERFGGLTGLRFNIGRVEGGIKANMIAPTTEVRFGFRPLPTMEPDRLLDTFRTLAEPAPAEFTETFRGPSLPAGDTAAAEARRLLARDLADELDIPVGNAVDFWTEAALFSAAGYTAFVYGPGDIAQAHTADEWVALGQLDTYASTVHRLVVAGLA